MDHRVTRVYPRPRGGTPSLARLEAPQRGLSPPTRGNHWPPALQRRMAGSIPAHAGEPRYEPSRLRAPGVYPRPRGGTRRNPFDAITDIGLSPPTRGNRKRDCHNDRPNGSIPAHAGEPRAASNRRTSRRVYPRPRGGTVREPSLSPSSRGLSPPTRGNRIFPRYDTDEVRSIPAHAGEPPILQPAQPLTRVYPRPRGGTRTPYRYRGRTYGLSPPTRGNRRAVGVPHTSLRSIPAHAGEPAPSQACDSLFQVYPRPRGGTAKVLASGFSPVGLSPPTRGNPDVVWEWPGSPRSIPAHAGEPSGVCPSVHSITVYPRPRGGTACAGCGASAGTGLSPPTRGNLPNVVAVPTDDGSIPAHAGEPLHSRTCHAVLPVYPRPRGGT